MASVEFGADCDADTVLGYGWLRALLGLARPCSSTTPTRSAPALGAAAASRAAARPPGPPSHSRRACLAGHAPINR